MKPYILKVLARRAEVLRAARGTDLAAAAPTPSASPRPMPLAPDPADTSDAALIFALSDPKRVRPT
ncbi:hypothetical protein [Methylobacterium haplocladii]|uniref:Uncharacterized protein n=1 Tax=Methylobacterium haplocladii TaxID=1176176 RepID=A0A512IS20_9HYPH|nr:hypothetical protein [Methylobacterium haplocladii]GEP00507.1 hypothetical protein MHA02_28940 [Methylobacterium haplocladii]GJD85422.1 hypothetical protein HPGCJGGD_3311 [Methylobacterium haplocladii]GLS57807.1 hypothetical protein GCM10007887_04630 [Methylobacterium haplocladii]